MKKRMEAQSRATVNVYQVFVGCVVGVQKSKPSEGKTKTKTRGRERKGGL